MKKLGKFLVVGAVAAVACAALVGCGGTNYSGKYEYASSHGSATYGVKVTVTVDGDTITKVTCEADTDSYYNITPASSWSEEGRGLGGGLGHDVAAEGLNDYLKKFEGAKVADVKALNVKLADGSSEPATGDGTATGQGKYIYTGATQTSGRIILAIQDALKDVK